LPHDAGRSAQANELCPQTVHWAHRLGQTKALLALVASAYVLLNRLRRAWLCPALGWFRAILQSHTKRKMQRGLIERGCAQRDRMQFQSRQALQQWRAGQSRQGASDAMAQHDWLGGVLALQRRGASWLGACAQDSASPRGQSSRTLVVWQRD